MKLLTVVVFLAGCTAPQQQNGDDDGGSAVGIDAGVTVDGAIAISDSSVACVPRTCTNLTATCGGLADGCGGLLDCGTCAAPAACGGGGVANVCAIPSAERRCEDGWCWESPSPIPHEPRGMFALSANDVWEVGDHGIAVHWTGSSWQTIETGTTADLYGVWMASANDGWIVGAGGTLLRWNGTALVPTAGAGTLDLHGVHGRAANDVYVVGAQVALRFNGTSWLPAGSNVGVLDKVWASSTSVFAIGRGQVWQLAGTAWFPQTPQADSFAYYDLNGIAGVGSTAYAVGIANVCFIWCSASALVYKWDGSSWTEINEAGSGYLDAYVDATTIVGVGFDGFRQIGATTTIAPRPSSVFHGVGAGGALFATSSFGAHQRYVNGAWVTGGFGSYDTMLAIGNAGGQAWFGGIGGLHEWRGGLVPRHAGRIVAVAGTTTNEVWAVDDHYDLVHQWTGTSWQGMSAPSSGYTPSAIHAAGSDVVLLSGGVYHLSGTNQWVQDLPSTTQGGSSFSVWRAIGAHDNDLFIVGQLVTSGTSTATFGVRTGGSWQQLAAPSTEVLCGIAVIAPNDIWAVGYDGAKFPSTPTGTVSHWDGTSWTTQTLSGTQKLCAITATDGQLWVSGTGSPLEHRDADGTWTASQPLALGSIEALATIDGVVWAAGDFGAVLRR